MTHRPDTDFAAALRAAVAARGVSLERVRALLAEHGVSISVATLSYWQTGRSRPERAASLGAIGPLETVLGVPRGFLAGRVDFRRGLDPDMASNLYTPAPMLDVLDDDWEILLSAFAQLGLVPDDGLARVSVHDRITLDADGVQNRHEVRYVLLAQRDGVDRFPIWYDQAGCRDGGALSVVPERNCRLGRLLELPEHGAVAAEIVLDRPLRQGETTLVQYRLDIAAAPPVDGVDADNAVDAENAQRSPSDGPSSPTDTEGGAAPAGRRDHFLRAVVGRVRELVLEVEFTGPRRPVGAEQVCIVGGVEMTRPLPVDGPLLAVDLDAEPGEHGIRWSW